MRTLRPTAVLLLAAVIFCATFAFFTVGTQADNTLTMLYVNDEVWYKTGIYPLRVYHSTYVPISIFEQIKGVTVSFYANNTAMIMRSKDLFISFDVNRGSAMSSNNERFYFPTRLVDGERYLPLLTTCEQLKLQCETYESKVDGSISVRICDGSQTKTFEELIAKYNPGALEREETTPPATETTVYIDPVENPAFFAVDGIANGGRIDALMKLCDEYAVSGAFFVRPAELEAYPERVLSLLAGGHSIGFLVEAEGALDALREANAALMRRYHRTSRLVRIEGEIPDELDEALLAAGYSRWGHHIDLGPSEASVRAALIAFRASLSETGQIVLRVDPDGYNTVGYLREFFNSAKDKRLFFPITPAYLPQGQQMEN